MSEQDHYMIDHDKVTIRCEFADGTVHDSGGNAPEDYPYKKLYEYSRETMDNWIHQGLRM